MQVKVLDSDSRKPVSVAQLSTGWRLWPPGPDPGNGTGTIRVLNGIGTGPVGADSFGICRVTVERASVRYLVWARRYIDAEGTFEFAPDESRPHRTVLLKRRTKWAMFVKIVNTDSNLPIHGARVVLRWPTRSAGISASSNASGSCYFHNKVPNVPLSYRVAAPGYIEARGTIEFSPENSTIHRAIRLSPKPHLERSRGKRTTR